MNTVKRINLGLAALLVFAAGTMATFVVPAQPVSAVLTCGTGPGAECPPPPPPASKVDICKNPTDDCSKFVNNYINPFIRLFSVLVGIGAALSLIIAGIQYSQSADDPSKVSKAKTRIVQTIITLLIYVFLFAILNYIIPGGVV